MTKKTYKMPIRMTLEEKERLEKLAKIEGCSTLTDFCRKRLFQSLSTEMKLNNIIELLTKNEAKNGKTR